MKRKMCGRRSGSFGPCSIPDFVKPEDRVEVWEMLVKDRLAEVLHVVVRDLVEELVEDGRLPRSFFLDVRLDRCHCDCVWGVVVSECVTLWEWVRHKLGSW